MKNLFKAVAEFQQEVPVIHKGTKGYGYTYADLAQIFQAINPLMAKHKLGFMQTVENDSVKTIIFHHESGESLEFSTSIPQDVKLKGMNDFQVLGSAITYIRRYALSSVLGLVTDKDTDAGGKQEEKKPEPKKQAKESISEERFQDALDAIKIGNFSVENLIKKFDLTEEQQKEVKKL